MAGNYPDVPGPRIAYDRDGSVAFIVSSSGVPSQMTQGQLLALADDSASTSFGFESPHHLYFGVILPVLHDIAGIFVGIADYAGQSWRVEASPDTTSGVDGTWTTVMNPFPLYGGTPTDQRSFITSVSVTGVRAVRVVRNAARLADADVNVLHLYGSPSSAPDRLRIWHPSLDQEVGGAYFDWGNVPRGAVLQRQFRVKNGRSLTAKSVSLSVEALTEASPAVVPMYAFSLDGATWSSSLVLGDLAPGATSAVVTVRFTCDPTAQLGLWTQRIVATAAQWV